MTALSEWFHEQEQEEREGEKTASQFNSGRI